MTTLTRMRLSHRAMMLLALINSRTEWEGDERPGGVLKCYWVPQKDEQYVENPLTGKPESVWVSGSGDAASLKGLASKGLIKFIKRESMNPYSCATTEEGIRVIESLKEDGRS